MSTRRSTAPSSGRKRRTSTTRPIELNEQSNSTEPVPPAAATSNTIKSRKSRTASETVQVEGELEFRPKKSRKTQAGTTASSSAQPAAEEQTQPAAASSSTLAPTPAAASVPPPKLDAPSYPSNKAIQKFKFDSSKPLPEGIHELASSIFAHELQDLTQLFGTKSKHPATKKGQLEFIVKVCEMMGQEVLSKIKTTIEAYMQAGSNDGKPMALENPVNTARLDAIEQQKRLTQQAEADTREFEQELKRLVENPSLIGGGKKGPITAKLSSEDEKFLQEHKGGRLAQQIVNAYASAQVKGNASLHILEQSLTYVQSVQKDQRIIAEHINKAEKKVYGVDINDPKALIGMITGASATPAAASASNSATAPADDQPQRMEISTD